MFEKMTFDLLLNRMLGQVPSDVDKREGSVVYDMLAPAAVEMAKLYSELGCAIDEAFADTAGRAFLVRRAAERGIAPHAATAAVVRVFIRPITGVKIAIGTRFAHRELTYRIIEEMRDSVFLAECETAGAVGNRTFGDLTPVDFVERFSHADIVGLAVHGRDEESTEAFRKRYFDTVEVRRFGGNIADYRREVLAISGVGGVRVFPGTGYLRLIILGADGSPPSEAFVAGIKEHIDPVANTGRGYGFAPIGHKVSVEAVKALTVNVQARFTMWAGFVYSDISDDVEAVITQYLKEVAFEWGSILDETNARPAAVRATEIGARVMEKCKDKLRDITNIRLNDLSVGQSIELHGDRIPVLGVVSNA